MRPIKDILTEEYWNIAFREVEKNDYIFKNKNQTFNSLKESKRYWYADPFLFEYKNDIWLFVEAFDNVKEKGLIACMKYEGGKFFEPRIVLEETFHLSYPFIFEENGEIFMMPETSEAECIQLYKALDFPYVWEHHTVLSKTKDAVDTVLFNNKLIVSVVTNPFEKRADVDVYDLNGNIVHKGLHKNSQTARGAGRIFIADDKILRPAQDSTGSVYGAGLRFYHFDDTDDNISEKEVYSLAADEFDVNGVIPDGVHTYARTDSLEIIDYKRKRFNLRRILWILRKKL